jgi:Ser/Thr protein kinase RdoA (MazF antagonist)
MQEGVTLPQEVEAGPFTGLVKQVLDCYALPENLTVDLINNSENETYQVEDRQSGQRWALRIHRLGYQSRNAIASEIAWLTALRKDLVVLTPVPVQGRNREFIQIVRHPSLREPRHAVLYEWEQGRAPDVGGDLGESFEMLGAVAARMHWHSKSWKRPAGFERLTWNFETSLGNSPHWGRWREGVGMNAEKCRLFGRAAETIRCRLARYGEGSNRFGLIHCDLRLANLLIHEGEVKVIDFDDCGFSWYMYDAATPISFYEHLPGVSRLIEYWLQGYRSVSPLDQADEDEIPTFLMLRRLLLVAWVGSHSEADLARSLGAEFTHQTVGLCDAYLTRFG